MVKVNFFNENGNVSVKVRDGIRPQALNKVFNILSNSNEFEGITRNANGGISIPIAEDTNGEIVFAHFEMTVSTKSPDTKTERKKTNKKAETDTIVPILFE